MEKLEQLLLAAFSRRHGPQLVSFKSNRLGARVYILAERPRWVMHCGTLAPSFPPEMKERLGRSLGGRKLAPAASYRGYELCL